MWRQAHGHCSLTYFLNEARGGVRANVRWAPHRPDGGAPTCLEWHTTAPIAADGELLVKYDEFDV